MGNQIKKTRVVILGAGFGGLKTARLLRPLVRRGLIELSVVDRRDYFLFTPLLVELISGRLEREQAALPLVPLLPRGVHFYHQEIRSLDLDNKTVQLASESLAFDLLVIATGSQAIPGPAGHARGILYFKDIADAELLKKRIDDALRRAAADPDEASRRRLLSWAVVGAGAIGTEVAAEINQELASRQKKFIKSGGYLRDKEFSVSLVSSGPEILSAFDPDIRSSAAAYLRQIGVDILFSSPVASLSAGGIILADQTEIMSENIIWSAGVQPCLPHFSGSVPGAVKGRLAVNQELLLAGRTDIFCLGDSACPPIIDHPLPLLAQVADQAAAVVADNIKARIFNRLPKKFAYKHRGELLSLGQGYAVGKVLGRLVQGRLARLIWCLLYAFKVPSRSAKWQLLSRLFSF